MADGHLPVIDLGEMEVMLIINPIDIIIVIIAIVIKVINDDSSWSTSQLSVGAADHPDSDQRDDHHRRLELCLDNAKMEESDQHQHGIQLRLNYLENDRS